MFNVITRLWPTVLVMVANLVKYPSLKGNEYHAAKNDTRQSIHHSGGSPFSDWLTHTAAYHH